MKTFMMREFQWITVICDRIQFYHGVNIQVQEHNVMEDMKYYIQQLLQPFTNVKEYTMPAVKDYCETESEAKLLDATGKKRFYTIIARLLYLAKCARSADILTATSFLCARVKSPNKRDQLKLLRVIGYLAATKNYEYTIKPNKSLRVQAYIDAACAAHVDSKSHSGVTVFIAGVLVYSASTKQTSVTKSPTKSELVALTDFMGSVELFDEFFLSWSVRNWEHQLFIKTASQ